MTPLDLLITFLTDLAWSGVAALGFAILFNVPRRLLLPCFVCGAVGHGIRTLLTSQGVTIEFATLVGAVAIGILSSYFSVRLKIPTSVFAITGAIPLVPGVFAYQTIVGLLNATAATGSATTELLVAAGINGVKTAIILAAIAFGTAAPILFFQRSHPVA
jgi:uncharacterized membrane protein YjjB (DUF3815 family)